MLKTMEQEWVEFKKIVYPKGMIPSQEQQVKKAFLAGGMVVAHKIMGVSEMDEEQGVKVMTGVINDVTGSVVGMMSDEARAKLGAKQN